MKTILKFIAKPTYRMPLTEVCLYINAKGVS